MFPPVAAIIPAPVLRCAVVAGVSGMLGVVVAGCHISMIGTLSDVEVGHATPGGIENESASATGRESVSVRGIGIVKETAY